MNKIVNWLRLLWIKIMDSPDGELRRKYYKQQYGIDDGKYTYGYNNKNIAKGTKIGSFCSIASGVKIGLMNHPMEYVLTHPFFFFFYRGFVKCTSEEIEYGAEIGHDVWIGSNAIILPNVRVGNGAVIGAGAVVTKDVAPYEIVCGVPAKHLKWRLEDSDLREKLNKIPWYDWSDDKIKENIELFYNPIAFVSAYYEKEIM